MPGTDGLVATRLIAAEPVLAATRVIVLTTFDLDEYVFEAIRAGASGFLVKDTEPTELLRAVRAVAGGDALLSPGVTRRLIGEFASRSRPGADRAAERLAVLTDREREVVALVGRGCRTTRSPTGWSSHPPPPRRMSRVPWSSCRRATGPSSWCWPTSRGWYGPAGPRSSRGVDPARAGHPAGGRVPTAGPAPGVAATGGSPSSRCSGSSSSPSASSSCSACSAGAGGAAPRTATRCRRPRPTWLAASPPATSTRRSTSSGSARCAGSAAADRGLTRGAAGRSARVARLGTHSRRRRTMGGIPRARPVSPGTS